MRPKPKQRLELKTKAGEAFRDAQGQWTGCNWSTEWGQCKTDLKDVTEKQARDLSKRYAAIAAYRARDTTLDRDVALKVLPDAFTADPDRLARFEREAKVLASLNHPNIGAIYGLEKSGDTRALVLELIEGPTLADRIAQGPIPYICVSGAGTVKSTELRRTRTDSSDTTAYTPQATPRGRPWMSTPVDSYFFCRYRLTPAAARPVPSRSRVAGSGTGIGVWRMVNS